MPRLVLGLAAKGGWYDTTVELALLHVTDEIDEVVRLVGESYQAWQDTH